MSCIHPAECKLKNPILPPEEILAEYDFIHLLGEGYYGSVYRVIHKNTGEEAAVKILAISDDGLDPTVLREIAIIKRINCKPHPNILRLKKISLSETAKSVGLVLEKCKHDLASLISRAHTHDQYIPRHIVRNCMRELLSGVQSLHCMHVIHRDLKPQNILIREDGSLAIADYGLSVYHAPMNADLHEVRAVTLWYRPPELLLGESQYDYAIDVWGIGCIFLELLLSVNVLNGHNEADQILKILSLLAVPSDFPAVFPHVNELPFVQEGCKQHASKFDDKLPFLIGSQAHDLLSQLLTIDPKKRITAAEALEHPYFYLDYDYPGHNLCNVLSTYVAYQDNRYHCTYKNPYLENEYKRVQGERAGAPYTPRDLSEYPGDISSAPAEYFVDSSSSLLVPCLTPSQVEIEYHTVELSFMNPSNVAKEQTDAVMADGAVYTTAMLSEVLREIGKRNVYY